MKYYIKFRWINLINSLSKSRKFKMIREDFHQFQLYCIDLVFVEPSKYKNDRKGRKFIYDFSNTI